MSTESLCIASGIVGVGLVKSNFSPGAARACFGQKPKQWVGMVRAVTVQLHHLIIVAHDREILGWLIGHHTEYLCQKGHFGGNIPHQKI